MKRIIFAAILLSTTAVAAHADSLVWDDITKAHRTSDEAVRADAAYCNDMVGMPYNGYPPPPEYKQCMLGHGWKYRRIERDANFVSPHGRHCHYILGGYGRECDN